MKIDASCWELFQPFFKPCSQAHNVYKYFGLALTTGISKRLIVSWAPASTGAHGNLCLLLELIPAFLQTIGLASQSCTIMDVNEDFIVSSGMWLLLTWRLCAFHCSVVYIVHSEIKFLNIKLKFLVDNVSALWFSWFVCHLWHNPLAVGSAFHWDDSFFGLACYSKSKSVYRAICPLW